MAKNDYLIENEQNSLRVSKYVQDYSIKNLEMPLDNRPLPNDASQAISDFISDLAHFASINGVVVSDVLSKALQNFLEEISGGELPEGMIDRFRALIDESIYDVTIGQVVCAGNCIN